MEKIKVTEENLLLFKNKAMSVRVPSGKYIYLPYCFKIEGEYLIPILFDNIPKDAKETILNSKDGLGITYHIPDVGKMIKSDCHLCDGRGRRLFLDCTPPFHEPCPVCNREEFLNKKNNKPKT